MGGRGAASWVPHVPNAKNAVISDNKISGYLLSETNSRGKHVFFNAIGYNQTNPDVLKRDLYNGLQNKSATMRKPNEFSDQIYTVKMELGVGDNKAMVDTAWQIDKGDTVPRFITAKPSKKRKEE